MLLTVAAVFWLVAAAAAQAAPDSFVVASNLDSTDGAAGDGDCDPNDDGSEADCTLRAAIQEANALDPEGGSHTIGFSGAMTIQPASPLPTLAKRVEINAGSDPECATTPANAIFIDGQGAVDIGLQINGQKSLVCGLTVGRFTEVGILVNSEQTLIKRSQIGTNTAGTGAMANQFGIQVSADEVWIEANLISGNTTAGVRIVSASSDTVFRGNRIGTVASGASALGNGTGIRVEDGYSTRIGGSSVAERNVISGNSTGIWVFGSSSGAKIEGNFIGASASGSGAVPNTGSGVWLNSSGSQTIGGAVSAPAQSTAACDDACNVISANGVNGVLIEDGTVTVSGNYVGIDLAGTGTLAQPVGISLGEDAQGVTIGGTSAARRNVIAGNTSTGVRISGAEVSGNKVEGNYIGIGPDGTTGQGNGTFGVSVGGDAADNTIGGATAGARNVISAAGQFGVVISGAGEGNKVEGNYIGTDAGGTLPRPSTNAGLRVIATNGTTIGGSAAGAGNVISGNGQYGVEIFSGDENSVLGNYLGPDATGLSAPGSQDTGVLISKGSGNQIGGGGVGEHNVISGNESGGIWLSGAETVGNSVVGNYVGLAADGDSVLANDFSGILVSGLAAENTIGGEGAAEGNVVSGNGTEGVRLENSLRTELLGNLIGTDPSGLEDRGNTGVGVLVAGDEERIGRAGAGNAISGNGNHGISISSSAAAPVIQGNLIGLAVDGETPLGNNSAGIDASIPDAATIGGSGAGEGNTISANAVDGISMLLATDTSAILGNRIGTSVDGALARGNGATGVDIANSTGVAVGGTAAGEGNTISANAENGIRVSGSTSFDNRLLGNSIYANGDLGIDLVGAAGVEANDPLDADETPANRGQNYPELATALTEFGETTVTGSLGSEPEHKYRLEFFASPSCDESGNGEGRTLLGAAIVTTDAGGDATIEANLPSTAPEQLLTATATDLDPGDPDGTSEFSACLPIPADSTPPDPEGPADPGPGGDSGAGPGAGSGPPPAAPPAAGSPPLAASPGLAVLKGRRAAVRGGKAWLKLVCRAGAGAVCRGVVRLTVRLRSGASGRNGRRAVKIGAAAYRLPAGRRRLLGVKLSGRGARLVRRAGRRGLAARAAGPRLKGGRLRLKPRRH